jgi:nucleoside-diphosphate-sugar epimerase
MVNKKGMPMRVLIIGGTGLISTPMTRMFLERGDDVTLFNRGVRPSRVPDGARQVHGDRTDFAAFEAQIAELGTFDCVVDMVCYDPPEAESAVRALRGRCGHYLFCSTVDVYQKPYLSYPVREDHPLAGNNTYGRNKRSCEALVLAAHERGELPASLMRPAHTYGEGSGLIHSFGWDTAYIDRLRRGKPIVVHGDGTSLWGSCYIDDVARAFVAAAGNPVAFGRAYTLAASEWQTWDDYHRRAAHAIGAPEPRLVHIPAELLARLAPARAGSAADNFLYSNIFDVSAAQTDLGFRQTVLWEEGVRRTVAWLDANDRVQNSDEDPLPDRVITAWDRLCVAMEESLA